MELYRITREKYAEGLQASGRANRWNFAKQYVIYAATSRSLAALELVAHRNAIMEGIRYKMLVIHVPNNAVTSVDLRRLPKNWQLLENRFVTQRLGSEWYTGQQSQTLLAPSAIIEQEFNGIINTMHPEFSQIRVKTIEDFHWDKRLL